MKLKTTNKAIRENSNNIIAIGYCAAQYLLRGVEPFAYTCGVYGWNADFYQVGSTVISTGYRPIGTHKSNKIVREYEDKARAIWENDKSYNDYGYEQRRADSYELLKAFVNA